MANQGPAKGKPTFNFLDTLYYQSQSGGNLEPETVVNLLQQLDQKARGTGFPVVVDPERFKRDHGIDYPHNADMVQSLLSDYQSGRFRAPVFKREAPQASDVDRARGIKPASPDDMLRAQGVRGPLADMRANRDITGTLTGEGTAFDTDERLAAARGLWVDKEGNVHQLTEGTHRQRKLVVDYQTDENGFITGQPGDPILREMRDGEEVYGKTAISKWGYQPKERTWLGAAATGAVKGASMIPGAVVGLYDATLGDMSEHRLQTLVKMRAMYGVPSKSLAADNLLENGSFLTGLEGVDHPLANMEVSQESAEKVYDQLKEDEDRWRELAKSGDKLAKLNVDIIDMGDGVVGKSVLRRIAASSHLWQDQYTPKESVRAQEGAFSSIEGLFGATGNVVSQVGLQMGAVNIMANGIMKLGLKSLTQQVVADGVRRTALNQAGTGVVNWTARGLEGAQMFDAGVRSYRDTYANDPDAAGNSALFGAIVAAGGMGVSSMIGTPWFAKSFAAAGGKAGYDKMVRETLMKETAATTVVDRAKNVVGATMRWLNEGSDNVVLNRSRNTLQSSLQEGFEEGGQEMVNAISEDVYDMFTDRSGFADARGHDYSFWSRVMEAAGLGAIAGGGMSALTGAWNNRPTGNDKDIWEAAFAGRSNEVIGAATRALKAGQLTQEDFDLIQQDVIRADVAAKGFVGNFDKYKDLLREDGSIATRYAEAARELESIKQQAAENEGGLPDAEQSSRIAELQETMEEISSGIDLVNKVSRDATVREAYNQKAQNGADVKSIADPVQAMGVYKEWAANQIEQAKTIRAVRPDLVKELGDAIETLKKSKADNFDENSLSVKGLVAKMQQAGAFMREDYMNVRSAYEAMKHSADLELANMDMEDGVDGLPSTILQKAEAWAFGQNDISSNGDLGDDLESWLNADIDGQGTTGRRVIQDSKNGDANDALNLFSKARAEHGGVDLDAHRDVSMSMPSERELEDPANPINFFNRIHSADPSGASRSMDPAGLASYYAKQETVTENELAAIEGQIDALRGMLVGARSMPEIVDRVNDLSSRTKKPLKAIASMKQDVDSYHARVAKDSPVLEQAIQSSIDALSKQYERLGGTISARKNNIERVRAREQAITTLLIDHARSDAALLDNKELALLYKNLVEETDPAKKEPLLYKVEDIIHRAMEKDPLLHKRIYDRVIQAAAGDSKQTGAYLTNSYLTSARVELWHSPAMFDPETRKKEEKAYVEQSGVPAANFMPAVRLMTANWLLRVKRVAPRLLVNHYYDLVRQAQPGKAVLSYEQEKRVMEIAAFMANPSEELSTSMIFPDGKRSPNFLPNTFWLNGFPGTGKTECVHTALALANLVMGKTNPRILIVTPGSNTTDTRLMADTAMAIPDATIVRTTMDAMPENLSDYDQVVIDEAHAMSTPEVDALGELVRKADVRPAVLVIGDPNQVSSSRKADVSTMMEAGRFAERAVPLTTSFRTGDSQLLNVFNTLRSKLYMMTLQAKVEPDMPQSSYTEGNKSGVQWVGGPGKSIEDVLEMGLHDLASGKAMIVVQDAAVRTSAIRYLKELSMKANLGPSMEHLIENGVRTMAQGEGSGLGMEVERVYSAIDPSAVGTGYTRMLYTAVSRAKNSVVAYLPNGRSTQVPSIPVESFVAASSNDIRVERFGVLRESTAVLGLLTKDERVPAEATKPKQSDSPLPPLPATPPKQIDTPNPVPAIKPNASPGNQLTLDLFSGVDSQPQPAPSVPTAPRVAAGHKSYSDVRHRLVNDAFSRENMTLGIFTGVHLKTENVDAHSVGHDWHRIRRDVLKLVSENPSGFAVSMHYFGPRSFYDTRDAAESSFNGASVEVQLVSDEAPSKTLVDIAESHGVDPLDPRLLVVGYMPLQDYDFGPELQQGLAITRLATDGLKDGDVIPGHDTIPVTGLLAGLPDAAGQGLTGYGDFLKLMKDQGNTVVSMGPSSIGIAARVQPFDSNPPLATDLLVTSKQWAAGDGEIVRAAMDAISKPDANNKYDQDVWNRNPVVIALLTDKNISGFLETNEKTAHLVRRARNGKLYFKKTIEKETDGPLEITTARQAIKEIEAYAAEGGKIRVPIIFDTDANQSIAHLPEVDALRNLALMEKAHVTEPVLQVNMAKQWDQLRQVGVVNTQQSTSSDAPIDIDINDSLYQEASGEDVPFKRISVEEAREYVRRVLGNRFVNGRLSFTPNLRTINGRRLHGVMERGRIGLNEVDGQVKSDTPRHETMHYVMTNLLDERSARFILDEAKSQLASERRVYFEQVSDRDGHERLADMYGTAEASSGPIGRFLSWLKGALNRWGLYRIRMEELGKVIDSGYFRTVSPRASNDSLYQEDGEFERLPLYRVFGSDARAQRLVRQVRDIIRSRSLFAQPQEGSMGVRQKTIKEVVDMIYRDFSAKAASRPSGMKVGEEDVNWGGLSYEQIVGLRGDDYASYVFNRVSQPAIFEAIIKEILPGVRFSDLMPNLQESAADELSDQEVPLDPDAGTASMASIIGASDTRNPITNQLALSLVLQDMRLLQSVDGVVTEDPRSISYRTVTESVLRNAAQGVSLSSNESAIDAMGKALLAQWRAIPNSREGQHALTLYWKLFATDETQGYLPGNTGRMDKKFRSYRWLVKNIDRVRREVGADPFGQAALEERFNMAEALQNAVIGQFMQLHTNNYIQSTYFADSASVGRIHSRELNFDKVGSEVQVIRNGTDGMFVASAGFVSVNENMRERFKLGFQGDVSDAEFLVDPTGVSHLFENRTVKLVSRSGLRFAMQKDADVTAITRFFSAAGYNIAPGTVEHMLKSEGGSKLADVIGMWATAIHGGVAQVMGLESGWSDSLLRQYASSGGLNLSFDDDPLSEIYRPSALFALNRELAQVNSTVMGSDFLRQVYDENSNIKYVDTIGSHFKRVLPSNHPKGYSSAATEEAAELILSMDPALKIGERFMNPLMNPKDPRRINSVLEGMGMQQAERKMGKTFNELHPGDQQAVIIDRFVRDLLGNHGRDEVLTLTLSPFADRNPTVVKLVSPAGIGKVFRVAKKGRTSTIALNDHVTDAWVRERFELLKHRAALAQADIDKAGGLSSMSLEQLKASDLIANYHYRLKGDSVLPGAAVEPMDPILNLANAEAVLNADTAGLRAIVDKMMAPMVQQYREGVARSGALLENVLSKVVDESRRDMARGYVTMSWLVDQWVGDVTFGADSLYKNPTDRVKRGSLPGAPSYVPPVEKGYEKSSFIVLSETEAKDLDGQGIETPWGYRSLLRRMGGEFGPLKPGAYKMVYSDIGVIDKASRAMPSPQYYRQNEWFRNQVQRSLMDHPELLALWNETIGEVDPAEPIPAKDPNGKSWGEGFARRYWDAADKVAAQARVAGIDVGQSFTSESNIKKGLRMVNHLEGTDAVRRLPIDLRFYGFQTDLSRSTENLKVSQATQILFMLGVMPGNAEVMQRLQNIESGVADAFLQKMKEEAGTNEDGTVSRTGFEDWLRSNSLGKAIGKNESTQLIDALMEQSVTINDPVVKQKVVGDFLNMLYRDGINPKVHGQQFTQASAYGLRLIETVTPLPQITPAETNTVNAAESLPTVDNIQEWTDDYSEAMDKESSLYQILQEVKGVQAGLSQTFENEEAQLAARAQASTQLEGLRAEGKDIADFVKADVAKRQQPFQQAIGLRGPRFEGGKYVPGEIMLPFVFAKQFGVTDPYLTLEDVRTDIFNRLGVQAAKVFEDSLLVYVSRTPASGTSSGNFMRVVGFINDAGNSIYVPAEFNKKTGGDNDGDQLTVLFRSLRRGSGDAMSFEKSGSGGMSNDLMDTLWSYYSNGANEEHTMAEIGTEGIVQALTNEDASFQLALHSPFTAMLQRKQIQDGAALVGIISNANKAYSVMMSAWNSLGEGDDNNAEREAIFRKFQPQLRDSAGRLTSTNISELLNAALDNVKLMLLGPAGITPENINLVLGAVVTGLPLDGLRQMMQDPLVRRASELVLNSTAMVKEGRPERRLQMDDALVIAAKEVGGEQDSDAFKLFTNFAHIGEVLSRMATVLRHRNNGIGKDEREVLNHVRQLEFILNTPLESLVKNLPAEAGHYRKMGADVLIPERIAQEARIREMFDHGAITKSMSGLMKQMDLINTASKQIGASIVTANPVMRNSEYFISSMLFEEPRMFMYDRAKLFDQEATNYLISSYLDQHGETITLDPARGPIDMKTRGGNMRFLYEFPSYWNGIMERIRNDERLSELTRDNHFLENVQMNNEKGVVSIEMKDNRKLLSTRLREMVRTDLAALSAMVGEEYGMSWDAPLMDQLALYSMVKDRFSYSKGSLMPFIAGTAYKNYGQFLSAQRDRMSAIQRKSVEAPFVDGYLKYNAVEVGRSAKGRSTASNHPVGLRVFTAEALHYGEDVVVSKGTMTKPAMTTAEYNTLNDGESIKMIGKEGASVVLPSGQTGRISKGILTASPANRYDPDNDAAPTVLYSIIKPGSMGSGTVLGDLQGLNMEGSLNRILSGISSPEVRRVAESFRDAAKAAGIDIRVRLEQMSSDVAGYVEQNGSVAINPTLGRTGGLVTLMHEISHQFTRHVLSMEESAMSPQESAFKKGVTGLHERAKKLKGAGNFEAYMSSPHEFVSGGHSDPVFQQWLQVNDDGETSFFDRLVKWIRSLLGLDAAHESILSELLDITDGYLDYASNSGRGFEPTTYEGRNADAYLVRHYSKRGRFNAVDTSKPIKDIRDLMSMLQTNDKTGESPDLAREAATRRELATEIIYSDRPMSKYTIGERSWDFSGKTEDEIKDIINREIIPHRRSFEQRRATQITDFLNNTSDLDSDATLQQWSEQFVDYRGHEEYERQSVRAFLKAIDPDGLPSAYLQYSDLANGNREVRFSDGTTQKLSELNIKYVKGFDGENPIIRIRKGDTGLSVDLFQFTTSPMSMFSTRGTIPHLLEKFMPGGVNNLFQRVNTRNNIAGARKFSLALTAMAIRQMNPGLAIRSAKVLSLRQQEFGSSSVQMGDLLREIGTMKKMPAIWSVLPEHIRAVLADDRIYDSDLYQQPLIEQLLDWAKEHDIADTSESIMQKQIVEQARQLQDLRLTDTTNLKFLLRQRANFIRKQFKTREEADKDKEYQLVLGTLQGIIDSGIKRHGSNRDKTYPGAMITNPHNMRSEIVQRIQTAYLNASNKVVTRHLAFTNEHKAVLQELDRKHRSVVGTVGERFLDVGWKRFERLFRHSNTNGTGRFAIRDKQGNFVKRRLNMLHWDKNDPETKALLKSGDLTMAELDYANWFLDRVREQYKRMVVENLLNSDTMQFRRQDGSPLLVAANLKAEEIMSKNWERGWVPIMRRPSSETIAASDGISEKAKNYASSLLSENVNPDALFDRDYDERSDRNGRVMNRWMAELGHEGSASGLGGITRLARLGITDNGFGDLTVADEKANDDITMNLETVLNQFQLAAERRIVHEAESVPVYQSGMAAMAVLEDENGISQTTNRKFVEDYVRRMIYGGPVNEADTFGNYRGVGSAFNITMKAASYSALAFNWQVAAMSGAMNTVAIMSNSFVSWATKDGYYTTKSAARAAAIMGNPRERNKVAALGEAFYLHEMSEQDMANTQIRSHTRRQFSSQRGANAMAQWTDKEARHWVMVAQMVEDGSWDAYSLNEKKKLVYDEKKDTRFYKNGKLTEDGALLRDNLRRRLVQQGLVGQSETGALKAGYDLMNARAFKVLSDKFVTGGMDSTTQAMFGSFALGRAVGQFRRYMPDRLFNWFGSRTSIDGLGRDVIKTNAKGEKMAVWEQAEVESTLNALLTAWGTVRTFYKLGPKEVARELGQMSKADKQALGRGLSGLITFSLITAMIKAFADDDDDTNPLLAGGMFTIFNHDRVTRILESTASDSFTPWSMAEQSGGQYAKIAPSLSFGFKMINAVFEPSQLEKLYPGRHSVQLMKDLYGTVTE